MVSTPLHWSLLCSAKFSFPFRLVLRIFVSANSFEFCGRLSSSESFPFVSIKPPGWRSDNGTSSLVCTASFSIALSDFGLADGSMVVELACVCVVTWTDASTKLRVGEYFVLLLIKRWLLFKAGGGLIDDDDEDDDDDDDWWAFTLSLNFFTLFDLANGFRSAILAVDFFIVPVLLSWSRSFVPLPIHELFLLYTTILSVWRVRVVSGSFPCSE